MENMEEIIFELITKSGSAKSLSYQAIEEAENNNFEKAKEYLNEADNILLSAHEIQTDLIHKEAKGEKISISVLFVHAQDHLMSSIEVRTLAENIIKLNKRLSSLENKC